MCDIGNFKFIFLDVKSINASDIWDSLKLKAIVNYDAGISHYQLHGIL